MNQNEETRAISDKSFKLKRKHLKKTFNADFRLIKTSLDGRTALKEECLYLEVGLHLSPYQNWIIIESITT